MFAHCLLPALLLLAAACVAQYLPPFSSTAETGGTMQPTHFRHETFYIPPGKCFHLIKVDQEYQLRCVRFGEAEADTSAHWLNVTVWDQAPSPDIYFLNNEYTEKTILLISRSLPCTGTAITKVDVACDYTYVQEPPRDALPPAPYDES